MLVSKKALLPFMQLVTGKGSGVGGEITAALSQCEQAIRRSPSPPGGRQFLQQKLPNKRGYGCIMLRGINLGLPDEIR
jgi:hypothetical protein